MNQKKGQAIRSVPFCILIALPGRRSDPASSSLKWHITTLACIFIQSIGKANEDETRSFRLPRITPISSMDENGVGFHIIQRAYEIAQETKRPRFVLIGKRELILQISKLQILCFANIMFATHNI